jgi:hypothetical protein
MEGSRRVLRAAILVTIALVVAVPVSVAKPEARASSGGRAIPKRWVGTWRLTSETLVDQAGMPAGSLFADTVGKLTYTARGDVWALVGPRSPSESSSAIWYTGTAEVDRGAGVVVHHVQYASLESWIGIDLVRGYGFFAHNKRLRLSAEVTPELTDILEWRRAGPRWAGPL